jgi:hypothetical protein
MGPHRVLRLEHETESATVVEKRNRGPAAVASEGPLSEGAFVFRGPFFFPGPFFHRPDPGPCGPTPKSYDTVEHLTGRRRG